MSETTKITVATALALHRGGQLEQAEAQYLQLWAQSPEDPEILHLLGLLHHQRGRNPKAHEMLSRAVALRPESPLYLSNLASVESSMGQHGKAAEHALRVLQLQSDHVQGHHTLIASLLRLQRPHQALPLARRLLKLQPDASRTYFVAGQVLTALGHEQQAVQAYEKCIALSPKDPQGYNNLGILYLTHHRSVKAIQCFDQAIALDPNHSMAINNRGVAYQKHNLLDRALTDFLRVQALNPDYELIQGKIADIRVKQCDWTHLDQEIADINARLQRGQACISPFRMLSLSDDPALNLRCSQLYARLKWPQHRERSVLPLPPPAARIRIGYFSADMHNHATAYLAAQMFESHNRQDFEVFIFSFGPNKQDEMRARLKSAVEHFIDISALGDLEIAKLARQHQLDIAVDLKGFTQDSRPGIFVERCAPVQVSYLGYPGSMGLPNMDYLVADAVVIPPELRSGYSECIAELPHSYQINDPQRPTPSRTPSRASQGLPDDALVLACFNNNYKIMPEVFAVWMRLLQQLPGSVLWLLQDNPQASVNLRQQAQASGVAPDRIVFAPRAQLPEHLSRQPLADLFLDTWPCNAHTTASDALWMGLPVITRAGRQFASRVAASLLAASGLPQLIAADLAEYERKVLALARDPAERTRLRQQLLDNRAHNPLFDAARTTRELEALYRRMHERARQGLPPDHLAAQAQA
jgi:protein O-GlcNAc transferase